MRVGESQQRLKQQVAAMLPDSKAAEGEVRSVYMFICELDVTLTLSPRSPFGPVGPTTPGEPGFPWERK